MDVMDTLQRDRGDHPENERKGEERRGGRRREEMGRREEERGGRGRFLLGSVGGLAGVLVECYSWQGMPQCTRWLYVSKVCLCIHPPVHLYDLCT